MCRCELLALGLGQLAHLQCYHAFQRAVLQGGQVADTGDGNVQVLQTCAACQRRDVLQIVAEDQFQEFQILQVLQGSYIFDGGAAADDELHIGHVLKEADVAEEFVVADVYVFSHGQILHFPNVLVLQTVGQSQNSLIGHAGVLAEPYTPVDAQIGVLAAELVHSLGGGAAVVQLHGFQLGHQCHGFFDLSQTAVVNGGVNKFDHGIGGADLLAEQLKGEVAGYFGDGILQNLDLFTGQRAGAVFLHQLHITQRGEVGQQLSDLMNLGGIHFGQVDADGIQSVFLAQQVYIINNGDIGVGQTVFQQLVIAGAACQVCANQSGVLLQLCDIIGSDHSSDACHITGSIGFIDDVVVGVHVLGHTAAQRQNQHSGEHQQNVFSFHIAINLHIRFLCRILSYII